MYAQGKGVTKDTAAGVDWLRKSAQQGNSRAQVLLAQLLVTSDLPLNVEESAFWLEILTAGGKNPVLIKALDATEKFLKPEQLEALRKRAQAWKPTPVVPGDKPPAPVAPEGKK
jgi:TPR repeat protein